MSDTYDVIYMLTPIKEVEPGWWKLKWRFIWKETVSIWWQKTFSSWGFGCYCYRSDARNGWHRSYKHFTVHIRFLKWECSGWIRWDFVVHKDGPSDMGYSKPLITPTQEPAP